MASHFSTIGFEVRSHDELQAVAGEAAQRGRVIDTPEGHYIVYAPGGGAELWVQATPGRELCGCNPHFAGTGRVRVGVTNFIPDPDAERAPLDGGLHGWANPPGDSADAGDYPFVVDLPDFAAAAETITPPKVVTMQVAAFAHELKSFADDQTFFASQEEGKPKFAAESFIPTGLFQAAGEKLPRPAAAAMFTGHVLASEVRTNPMTGRPFHWLSVRTLGGVFDVVADPSILDAVPTVGGVVQGSFWLSGRVLSDIEANRPSRNPAPSKPGGLWSRLFGGGR